MSMKRFFMLAGLAAALALSIQRVEAQEKGEWSVKIGVGELSLPDVVGSLVAGLGSIDTTEGTENEDFVTLLNPNVEAHYGINDWLSVGGSFALGYASAKSVFEETQVVNKSAKVIYPTLAVVADTRYFVSNNFAMYGSWGLGAMGLYLQQRGEGTGGNNDGFAVSLMGNIYPLCFSFGKQNRVAGFVEVGWGAKGICNIGIEF